MTRLCRVFNIVCSVSGLLALSPLLALIAFAIKLACFLFAKQSRKRLQAVSVSQVSRHDHWSRSRWIVDRSGRYESYPMRTRSAPIQARRTATTVERHQRRDAVGGPTP